MPTTSLLPVKQLKLDLNNFRTVPQKNEISAVHAMISINPDWFWALMESLLADGYHPTENIIVLKGGKDGNKLVVKEGNRRIGALKLIYGYIKLDESVLPSHIEEQIASASKNWKASNREVPCAIYDSGEAELVDKIVTLTHGKGEKAGRDKWNAIARARHNRDRNGVSEPALDLLEKYLQDGKNVNAQQRERWGGEYPLTVLEEAIKKLASRLGLATSRELSDQYPGKAKHRTVLENIVRDIGSGILDFKKLRDETEDFGQTYGIPAPSKAAAATSTASGTGGTTSPTTTSAGSSGGTSATTTSTASGGKNAKAVSTDDPKAVMRALKSFTPRGKNREKLVTLLKEARLLVLNKHPHAFCFLLRSMFEISAKAYCIDHAATGGLATTKVTGEDRALVDVLRDISNHLTKNSKDKPMIKALHGAMTELAKKEGILSVTSLNQLVHNPKFTVDETHISTVFGNIFPLLEEMNR
ncbi:MAG: hypothetical protein K8H75_17760 [Sulfuricella sp.]|nr:hypothetical protein [Sulfuricella sp.]